MCKKNSDEKLILDAIKNLIEQKSFPSFTHITNIICSIPHAIFQIIFPNILLTVFYSPLFTFEKDKISNMILEKIYPDYNYINLLNFIIDHQICEETTGLFFLIFDQTKESLTNIEIDALTLKIHRKIDNLKLIQEKAKETIIILEQILKIIKSNKSILIKV